MVTEVLEGESLRDVIRRGALPESTAVRYAMQIAEGLAEAHSNAVVVGDLKPENIFITADARVKLIGVESVEPSILAPLPEGLGDGRMRMIRADQARRVLTDPVAYMSPEQVRWQAVDHRTDVFSFGGILYEMVTGRPPFRESSLPETMAAILRLDPPPLPPHVSPVISNVVRRCLTKEPSSRFESARHILRALADPQTANVAVRSASSDSVKRTETGASSMLQYRVLRHYWPAEPPAMKDATAYANRSKLEVLVGAALGDVTGKTVIDFGCGFGFETVDLVRRGAARVIGVDVDPDCLAIARHTAAAAGLSDKIELMRVANGAADVVVSLDSFEHYSDPASILDTMYRLLKPGGALVVSFGATWFHPWGGHIFSVFPWAHLLFSEAALLRWREDLRPHQPRTSFLDAGLNQMTIKRFERLIDASPFTIEFFETVPIRRLRRFHNWVTREFFTSIIRCRLRRSA